MKITYITQLIESVKHVVIINSLHYKFSTTYSESNGLPRYTAAQSPSIILMLRATATNAADTAILIT